MFPRFMKLSHKAVVPRLAPGVIVAALGLYAIPSVAEWRVAPSIGVGVEYDDNASLALSSAPNASVNGYLAEAEAAITYRTPLANFAVTPTVLLKKYDDDDGADLDSNDFFLDFNYDYSRELSNFNFRGNFSDESVRTSEISDVDFGIDNPDEISEDASGRILGNEKRQRLLLNPEWSRRLGQRSRLRIGANYIDVTYDSGIGPTYSDYQETIGQIGYEYNWSERDTFSVKGFYRRNEFDDNSMDLSGSGTTIGWSRDLTENTRFISSVGIDISDNSSGENENNVVGEISLLHRLQITRILASYRRVVTGSGIGVTYLRDSVSLNLTRDLSQKVSISAGARAYQTSALDNSTVSLDEQDYLQLRAMLTWRLTREFDVELDYSYTTIDRDSSPSDADSNRVNLWFRYRPQL